MSSARKLFPLKLKLESIQTSLKKGIYMDDLGAMKLMSDKEVTTHYDRSLLDMLWLTEMVQSCTPKSPAFVHYDKQLQKERMRLDRLEEQLISRGLMH